MKRVLNIIMEDFGYVSFKEFAETTFHISYHKPILLLSVTLGTVATMFERFIGIEPMVYIAFLLLLLLEFVTGIMASLREGNKIESKKLGRFIFKIIAYTLALGIINVMKTRLPIPMLFGAKANIYAWIYYIALNMIIIQLIISVFENFARLGFKESSKIFNIITKAMNKWFKLDE